MEAINYSDALFVFVSAILVMLMTPALSIFYSGMVKRKNVLSTTMHSYILLLIVSVQWLLFGYSLAFGKSVGGLIGDFSYLFQNGVGFAPNAVYAPTIPQNLFMMFQMMFAIITPAIISGACAERIKFSAYVVFITAWMFLAYDPLVNWVWGDGGWLRNLGVLDFAGGYVVEIASGVAGLVIAIVVGKRKNMSGGPHSMPLTFIGVGLLWFGWFGFNAGSALKFNDVAMTAFITTNTAGAVASVAWIICEIIFFGKPTALGAASGIIAGLVAITPAAGFVSPMSAIIIGLVAGAVCFYFVTFVKKKFGYDDTLDAFGCHGIGGTWGIISVGLFAQKSINEAGGNGLFFGNPGLLVTQLIGIAATYVFIGGVTFIILKVIEKTMGLRSTNKDEDSGLDIAYHGESAYGDIE